MQRYLPSSGALDKLCHAKPDQPYKHGVKKTLRGGGLLLFGGVSTAMPFVDLIPGVGINVRGEVADKVADVGCVVLGVGCIGGSLYLLPDGIHSLLKPLRNIAKEERIYEHNGGYTNRPTWADEKYGTRIYPVDSVGELVDSEGHVFVNGFEVLESNIRNGLGKLVSVKEASENPYKSFLVFLTGKLQGEKMYSSAWLDYSKIKELLAMTLHAKKALCLVGATKENERVITPDFFHEAFTE